MRDAYEPPTVWAQWAAPPRKVKLVDGTEVELKQGDRVRISETLGIVSYWEHEKGALLQ